MTMSTGKCCSPHGICSNSKHFCDCSGRVLKAWHRLRPSRRLLKKFDKFKTWNSNSAYLKRVKNKFDKPKFWTQLQDCLDFSEISKVRNLEADHARGAQCCTQLEVRAAGLHQGIYILEKDKNSYRWVKKYSKISKILKVAITIFLFSYS